MLRAATRAGQWSVYALLSLYLCWPIFAKPQGLGIMDWDQHFLFSGAVIKSLFAFHQLPFWNPWTCGGQPLWQNPQVALLSPTYLFAIAVSLPLAMKLNILTHYLIGFAGMRRLIRGYFGINYFALEVFLASIFVLAGGLVLHLGVGHSTFLAFFYLPWALAWLLTSFDSERARPAYLAGAALGVAIINGGIHATAMFALVAALLSLAHSMAHRRWWPLLALLLTGAVALCLSAPKLLPVAALLRDARFVDLRSGIGDPGSLTWSEIGTTLIGSRPADWPGWFEYGNYVGLLAVSLGVGAAWTVTVRRSSRSVTGIALAGAIFVCLLIVRGNFSLWSPFALLQHVPVYGSFREPSRYTLLVALLIPALIADAVRRTNQNWPAATRALATTALLFATVDLAAHNRTEFAGTLDNGILAETGALREPTGAPTFDTHASADTPDSPMLRGLIDNRDVVSCYDPLQLRRTVDPTRDIVFASPGTELREMDFAPNRVRMTVTTRNAGAITLNQNYLTGWQTSVGRVRVDGVDTPLQVVLPAGFSGAVTLRFIPPGLWLGLGLFAIGLGLPLIRRLGQNLIDRRRATS